MFNQDLLLTNPEPFKEFSGAADLMKKAGVHHRLNEPKQDTNPEFKYYNWSKGLRTTHSKSPNTKT